MNTFNTYTYDARTKLLRDFTTKFKGSTAPKPIQHYTGTEMVGLVTQHKSNIQPVFSVQAATDSVKVKVK